MTMSAYLVLAGVVLGTLGLRRVCPVGSHSFRVLEPGASCS